jgi:hypothetical protein
MDQNFYTLAMKFLDRYFYDNGPSSHDSYVIYQRSYDDNDFDGYNEILLEYDYTDNRLYIDSSVVKSMGNLLSIKPYDSRILVCKWFSERNNVKISFTDTPGGYDRIEF